MKTVILCGGQGTRIRDVAEDIPKPMIPIGTRPILWHIMKNYAAFGFNEFVLCLGYRGHVIKNFFINYDMLTNDFTLTLGQPKSLVEIQNHNESEDWTVTLAETGLHAMTGDRVRAVRKYVEDDDIFMLTYGDGLSDIDIERLVAFHKAHGKIATVTGVRPPGRFGELESDDTGQVLEFNEKPQATGGRISGGFFVFNKGIFDYLPDGDGLVLEDVPLRKLVADQQLMVYDHDGFWQCMDTYRDFKYLTGLWDSDQAPWKNWK
ncbi:MAG: glucose-1-phosphate cytidylyltransferase [Rhodospirillales bacterium]|nr:glucose-1-phosphate cytidylyltransferase [Rhodospirillales bacterium]MBO6787690.1 glucose-1-phosphate cytidylyltransferase [Rhodospirillales bacterium]